jgi:hypothetical protein
LQPKVFPQRTETEAEHEAVWEPWRPFPILCNRRSSLRELNTKLNTKLCGSLGDPSQSFATEGLPSGN